MPSSSSRSFGIAAVERRLIDLQYELRMTEIRIKQEIAERDRAWRDRVIRGVPIFCNVLAKLTSPHPAPDTGDPMNETNATLPSPAMEPQRVNIDQYRAYAPDKVELLGGYVFRGEERIKVLRLLFVNVGLREVIKLLPAERWREAVAEVYGSE